MKYDNNSMQSLLDSSIMIIGQKKESSRRITWNQLHDSAGEYEENDLRNLLTQISEHIIKKRIPSGSARKFLDGKLLYVEKDVANSPFNYIYCLFTKEMEISNAIKKAFNAVVYRGGEYSSKRFFKEMLELLRDEDKLKTYSRAISIEDAKEILEKVNIEEMEINHLGRIVSLISHSEDLDINTLEKIYLIVYEIIQKLETGNAQDPDEFLDAAFLTATLYEEEAFHLSMELFKKIIPLAVINTRHDLEIACHIQLCMLYRDRFPDSGELILTQLSTIDEDKLEEVSKKNLEEFYVIKGHAYFELAKFELAEYNYTQAIKIASNNISSPNMIAEAYASLAGMNYKNYLFNEASRQYLTASAIIFSTGDISLSDQYLQNAGLPDIYGALAYAMSAITFRMEENIMEAEFKSWEALKLLVRAYLHARMEPFALMDTTEKIIAYTEAILVIPGKKRKNGKIIRQTRKLIDDLTWNRLNPGTEEKEISKVLDAINSNVPLQPPTFMLLMSDGRLIIMGKVLEEDGWVDADIKGVILSGIISAITSLISEVGESDSQLKTIDAGSMQIMLEPGSKIIGVLLVDRELPIFRKRLFDITKYITSEYEHIIDNWDGSTRHFKSLVEILEYTFSPSSLSKLL